MQLNSVEISNFKGIEHCKIELKPGFNLIIGENGKGKTSILEAIAVGLGDLCRYVWGHSKKLFIG